MSSPDFDQQSFEVGLDIVKSARERNVHPRAVWMGLRAAMPPEYRTDDIQSLVDSCERQLQAFKALL